LFGAALLAGCSNAFAADGAEFNAIGYSPDSRYFAFEQYGVQDGSGFPYWQVFIIDLKENAWVKGGPIRVVLEDEQAKLSAARDKARTEAQPLLAERNITEPPVTLAANPATEALADPSSLTFDRWYPSTGARPAPIESVVARHELSLGTVKLPDPAGCSPEDGPYLGFTLTLKDVKLGTAQTIHGDKSIPTSRGCTLDYDLAAVVAPSGYPDTDRLVAIVGVYTRGFEGADHRFIAVPFTLSD
jgi:predicted secreted protein